MKEICNSERSELQKNVIPNVKKIVRINLFTQSTHSNNTKQHVHNIYISFDSLWTEK